MATTTSSLYKIADKERQVEAETVGAQLLDALQAPLDAHQWALVGAIIDDAEFQAPSPLRQALKALRLYAGQMVDVEIANHNN